MSACADKQLLLHGLLDGELDAANTLSCEAHLAACPDCANEFARLKALRARLRAPGVAYQAPGALRQRVLAGLNASGAAFESTQNNVPVAELSGPVLPPSRTVSAAPQSVRLRGGGAASWRWRAFWTAGGSIVAVCLAFVVVFHLSQSAVTDEVIASHVRSLLASHLVDVETSDRHVVKPWFAGKVDFSPVVLELADHGFPLVGGRLDYIHGRVVAALVYRRRQHIINVFVWPAGGAVSAPASSHRDGYNVTAWTQAGMEFRAVSDVDAADLGLLRDAFEAQSGR